jgi:hypothetical protein
MPPKDITENKTAGRFREELDEYDRRGEKHDKKSSSPSNADSKKGTIPTAGSAEDEAFRTWRNPVWAYLFIACFVIYIIAAGYLVQDFLRNADAYLGDLQSTVSGGDDVAAPRADAKDKRDVTMDADASVDLEAFKNSLPKDL